MDRQSRAGQRSRLGLPARSLRGSARHLREGGAPRPRPRFYPAGGDPRRL